MFVSGEHGEKECVEGRVGGAYFLSINIPLIERQKMFNDPQITQTMRGALIGQLCCDVAVLPLHCVVVVMSCTGVMLSSAVLCCGCALAGGSLNSRPTSAAPRSPAPRPVAPARRLSSAWIRPPRPSPAPTRARSRESKRGIHESCECFSQSYI